MVEFEFSPDMVQIVTKCRFVVQHRDRSADGNDRVRYGLSHIHKCIP